MRHFTWDPIKAQSNLRKHGVSFEEAELVFADAMCVITIDNYEHGDERLKAIGMIGGCTLLAVIHTAIDEDGDEYIRIISARLATTLEEKIYSQGMGPPFH